MIEIQI